MQIVVPSTTFGPLPRDPVVGHLRVHVHRGADAVARRSPRRCRTRGRGARRASVRLSSTAAPTAYRLSPTRSAAMPAHSEASVSSIELEVLGAAGVGAADDDADRGVAVPEADLGAAVDREQVALAQHPRARDAVHDLLVDRGAQGVAVAGDELEVRDAAVVADVRLGEGVELEGGHARAHRRAARSSSVRPTSRPAVRMPASCSGVLPSQRSRLNRPMPRNPTGAAGPTPTSRAPSAGKSRDTPCRMLCRGVLSTLDRPGRFRRCAGSTGRGRAPGEAGQVSSAPRPRWQVLGPELLDPPAVVSRTGPGGTRRCCDRRRSAWCSPWYSTDQPLPGATRGRPRPATSPAGSARGALTSGSGDTDSRRSIRRARLSIGERTPATTRRCVLRRVAHLGRSRSRVVDVVARGERPTRRTGSGVEQRHGGVDLRRTRSGRRLRAAVQLAEIAPGVATSTTRSRYRGGAARCPAHLEPAVPDDASRVGHAVAVPER